MVSEKKMFENVDGRTDAGVTGILIAHLGAFGSGELKTHFNLHQTKFSKSLLKNKLNLTLHVNLTSYARLT